MKHLTLRRKTAALLALALVLVLLGLAGIGGALLTRRGRHG